MLISLGHRVCLAPDSGAEGGSGGGASGGSGGEASAGAESASTVLSSDPSAAEVDAEMSALHEKVTSSPSPGTGTAQSAVPPAQTAAADPFSEQHHKYAQSIG